MSYTQYSQDSGKKKALCVGINYLGQDRELKGCINDANNMKNFLMSTYGYELEDIVILTDDATDPSSMPTRENIIQGMHWLVRDAQPGDSLFFHFSGHGGQTKDYDGDEADGYDEVIYPVDSEEAEDEDEGHIVDDLIHDIMVKPLPAGCRLTAVIDACHSGSAMDLPYVYSAESGLLKQPRRRDIARQMLLSAAISSARRDMQGVFRSAKGLIRAATGSSKKAERIAMETKTSPADVISWTSCKDWQGSGEVEEEEEERSSAGAMTYAFIKALEANKDQTYQELLTNIRQILLDKGEYFQTPQLACSHPIDTSLPFIC
ncbi:peptidase C14 [Agrocybe pediades]|nr:peptidase C14 [Agrocybe pediades]